MEEGQRRGQNGAGCRQPVTIMVDAADGGRRDGFQIDLEAARLSAVTSTPRSRAYSASVIP
jgi:hypothetical protein